MPLKVKNEYLIRALCSLGFLIYLSKINDSILNMYEYILKMTTRGQIMIVFSVMSLFLITAGTLWILSELSKLDAPPSNDPRMTYNDFRMSMAVCVVVVGCYIMFKNIIFRDTILY